MLSLGSSGCLAEMAAGLEGESSVPFLSVAQTFPGKLVSIVYNPELPAVHCHHCPDIQHVSCDLLIAAPLQEGLTVFDVVLHRSSVSEGL